MSEGLDSAYSIATPADCLRVYRAWAESYDGGFAAGMDYLLPAHVARAFLAAGGAGPVLDIGAGTGLLAERLRGAGFSAPIDGVDLSPEMLERARVKGIYRSLVQADVMQPLPLAGGYGGIVSSGTFTHGHVGPSALPHVLAQARRGAQVALSINAGVFAAMGFDAALAALPITGLQLIEVEIYGQGAALMDPAHASDRALIALFRKG
ncbi:class I SAM-dependent DNA methyltransferase [Paragemmobacter straminiformis]|uniref:Class I SAM-dependent methyltransferase n=1 Tax=Paragemmobacter straminiformis TaxID=2045119 RepID=A0A842I5V1_9RHOB|nr:class I SAM-dependent methyltransferase [Gemmobacter straminiformis]MBC2834951.1 class I SAM-dependent methyltransferase [Gemmobacter straminiformis]